MSVWHILSYISVLFFVSAVIRLIYKISTAPVHLRWELYPVPHEGKRSAHGGSRLEETDWWTRPQDKDMLSEFAAMLKEILLLKGVWDHNKKLWLGSYPFHLGLYFFMVNTVLLLFAAVLKMITPAGSLGNEEIITFLPLVITAFGWIGAVAGIAGSAVLFIRRLVDPDLSAYSTPGHFFNIILIGSLFMSAIIWMATDINMAEHFTGYIYGMLTFSQLQDIPAAAYVNIAIALFFLVYLPLTHMTHFFTKYFTYHKVRWDDEAIEPGSKMAGRLAAQLESPVSWAAPHIGADGKKSWIAVASSMPEKEVGK